MLSQLLEDKKKKPKAKTLSKKSKDKRKEGESSSSAHTEEEEHSNSELSKPSSEEEDNSENTSTHSKRISKLEQRLEALSSRKGLQEVGVVWSYPTEWDLAHTLISSKLWPYRPSMARVTEPAHILLQVSDRECSIKWCHPSTFVHRYLKGNCFRMVHEAPRRLHQELEWSGEAFPYTLLQRQLRDYHANSPSDEATKWRVS